LGNVALLDPASATANPQASLLQPGLHAFDPNSEIGRRLK